LNEVDERFTAVDVAESELAGEREKAPDELLACGGIPLVTVREE
jgi:hypothetical protein